MKYFIFAGQVAGLISFLFLPLWWENLWVTAIMYFLGSCLGGTMTYHRLLAHRSWKCPKFVERLFVAFETVMLSGSAIAWVAIHREHHKHTDTEKDPHSPMFKGFLFTHFMSMFIKPKVKYAVDLMRDRFYVLQHKFYIHINISFAVLLFLIDPWAVVYAWLAPAALVWHANSLIISFSHKDGRPSNNDFVGFLTFGEGWHKNHHDNWKRKRLHKFDVGGILINELEK